MHKIMSDQLGEEAERRHVTEWCRRNGITHEDQAELLQILYGTKSLTKGDIHDRQ